MQVLNRMKDCIIRFQYFLFSQTSLQASMWLISFYVPFLQRAKKSDKHGKNIEVLIQT